MTWEWALIAVAALLLLQAMKPAKRKAERVLLLGDSLAVGLAKPLVGRITKLGHSVGVAAEAGTTVANWLPDAGELLEARTIVLVSLGTNDCKDAAAVVAQSFAKNAAELKQLADNARAEMIWLVPTWVPWWERILLSIPHGTRRHVATAPELSPDGIHPTPHGYRQWADRITTHLFS